jgi:hypothetical protein
MPEALTPSTQSLQNEMERAVERLYLESPEFKALLSTIQAQNSVTGTVANDNTYAALLLRGWAKDAGSYTGISALELKDFITLFRKARRKLGVDSSSRLKLAKQNATPVETQVAA